MDPSTDTSSAVARFKECISRLPHITTDQPGVGGEIKAVPEHFEVEEMLPYAASGEGEHLYVTLRRKGWNTTDVAAALAEPFGLKARDIGWGGRKDKQAITTQTFSLPMPLGNDLAVAEAQLAQLPFDILAVQRHGNKIRTGHVAANRFRIVLSGVGPEALAPADAIADRLRQRGLPNFYGEQRFGIGMGNLDRAMALIRRQRPARGAQETFWVSVLQSALFNVWLSERMARGDYATILQGDVAQKTDTGGLFTVDDPAEAADRFARRAIVYTGPIYGHKMMPAAEPAAAFEARVLTDYGLTRELFKRLRAPGSRRRAILHLDDLHIAPDPDGLRLTFTLPPGAYATIVLREFTRPPFLLNEKSDKQNGL